MEEKKRSAGDWAGVIFGSSFGLGYMPVAPGTFGALPAVANYLLIYFLTPPAWHIPLILASLIFWSVFTVAASPWAERYYNKKDPGTFVPDEDAGYLMTVLIYHLLHWIFYGNFLSFEGAGAPLLLSFLGWTFVTNRIIDIIKVFPANKAEELHGGVGILLDDLIAGLYAACLCHLVWWLWPGGFQIL